NTHDTQSVTREVTLSRVVAVILLTFPFGRRASLKPLKPAHHGAHAPTPLPCPHFTRFHPLSPSLNKQHRSCPRIHMDKQLLLGPSHATHTPHTLHTLLPHT